MEIRHRKPFSDITNAYNLIPTSTLRKLVSSSSASNSIPALKSPISILKPDSRFGGQKGCPDSSPTINGVDTRSDTRIGSSLGNVLTSRTVRFQNHKFPATSITRDGDVGHKHIGYDAIQATDKFKNERKTSAIIGSSTPLATKKDKGKVIVELLSFTPHQRTETPAMTDSSTPLVNKKDKGKAIAELPSFIPHQTIGKPCSSLEKTEKSYMETLSRFGGSFDKAKGFGKGILNPSSCSYEKTENRNGNLNYAGWSMNKTRELGKGSTSHSSYSVDKKKDEVEVILELPGLSVQKRKAVGKATLNSNDYLVDKTQENLKTLNHPNCLHEIGRDKGKALLAPFNMVSGSSAAVAVNCQPARRNTVKRKVDSGASSCPPMRRIQKILKDFDEAGDMKSSKSLTALHPKFKKKQGPQPKSGDESCLPLNFIEQQRAYFKEVDEFELAEEEISQDELD